MYDMCLCVYTRVVYVCTGSLYARAYLRVHVCLCVWCVSMCAYMCVHACGVCTCGEPACMCVHVCADLNYKAEGNRSACRGCTPWGVDAVSSWGLALRTTLASPKGPLSSFGSVRPPAVSLGDSSETRVGRPIWTKLSELLWGLRPQHLSVPSPPGQKAEWWPGHGLEGDWAEGQGGRAPGDPPARPPGNSGLRGLQLGPRAGGWRPGSQEKGEPPGLAPNQNHRSLGLPQLPRERAGRRVSKPEREVDTPIGEEDTPTGDSQGQAGHKLLGASGPWERGERGEMEPPAPALTVSRLDPFLGWQGLLLRGYDRPGLCVPLNAELFSKPAILQTGKQHIARGTQNNAGVAR